MSTFKLNFVTAEQMFGKRMNNDNLAGNIYLHILVKSICMSGIVPKVCMNQIETVRKNPTTFEKCI